MSNVVQKSKIFYEHNTVTRFTESNPHQGETKLSDPKVTRGKVLIIVNEKVVNRLKSHHGAADQEEEVKKLYIYLTMKNRFKTQEEAEK